MTMSGDLPEKRGYMQPDGSIGGCDCGYCWEARAAGRAQDSTIREESLEATSYQQQIRQVIRNQDTDTKEEGE